MARQYPIRMPLPIARNSSALLRTGGLVLAALANSHAAVVDIGGDLTQPLDTVVGAGNSARLVANTRTIWNGTDSTSDIDLNGHRFDIDTGGGNAQTYNGTISGPGSLRIAGRPDATWTPDARLGGPGSNTPGSVLIVQGRVTLNKTAGRDALAGAITVDTSQTVRMQWQASDQIHDNSAINATPGSGAFVMELGGFSETLRGLAIKAGHVVDTGGGGVLTVTDLSVGGEVKGPGIYTLADGFVAGSGSVVVPGATPPADAALSAVDAVPPTVVANGIGASTVTVTLRNAGGGPATGKSVTLSSDRGATDSISLPSGVSNAAGVVSFTVRSLSPGEPVFTASSTTDAVTVTGTASVSFTANPPASASESILAAPSAPVPANGLATATVTVILRDAGGSPVAGKTVTLASDRGATDSISAASGVSNASGVVTFSVSSLSAGNPVFTATVSDDGFSVTRTAGVTFSEATNVVEISNALTPWEPANPGLGVRIDAAVGSDKSARLVGQTQTHWSSGGFSRAVDLNGELLVIDSGGGNAMLAGGPIAGDGKLRVNGGGVGVLRIGGGGGNTYTGATEIRNGPVKLEKTSGNALNGPVAVNGAMSNNFPGTGTLLWGGNDQISDTSDLTLADGSSLNLAGYTDTMGTLALNGDANLYLGGSTSVARFAGSSAAAWAAGKQLVIREWNGSVSGGGGEAVSFGISAGGLAAGQLAKVGFMDPAGFPAGLYPAAILATGEVVPAGSAIQAVDPPYDLSPAATAARTALYTSNGRADLTAAASPLEDGTRIVFFGDSITWQNNYLGLLDTALGSGAGTKDKNITLINRGINGGGVLQVRDGAPDSGYPGSSAQASFDSLLVSDQADIAVVFIGINDVWWRDTPAATYEQALRDLAATAEARGVTLILATPAAREESPVGAGPDDPEIDQFSAIVGDVAGDTGSTFVNLRRAFVAYWRNHNHEIRLDGGFTALMDYGLLTYDGVHPTSLGNRMIADHLADGILAALGGGSPFDGWASLHAGGQSADQDFDHDGVPNGVEYFMGETGSSFTPNPPVVASDGVRTVTWPRDPAAVASFKVQVSEDLDGWTDLEPPHASIDESHHGRVVFTLPAGSPGRFCRLVVTP
jgi:lysophospholipase L1-like esterase